MKNFNLHLAITARGENNRKDFSLLLWLRHAHKQWRSETDFKHFSHLVHLTLVNN